MKLGYIYIYIYVPRICKHETWMIATIEIVISHDGL